MADASDHFNNSCNSTAQAKFWITSFARFTFASLQKRDFPDDLSWEWGGEGAGGSRGSLGGGAGTPQVYAGGAGDAGSKTDQKGRNKNIKIDK